MKKIIVITAAIALLFSLSIAQNTRIAYVDSRVILGNLPEAQKAQSEIQAAVKEWQEEIAKMEKELKDQAEAYQKQEAMLDPKAKAEKQKAFQDLQTKAREYQFKKFDQNEGEIVKLNNDKMKPIQERVLAAISKVAKAEGFQYVFEKLENQSIILYADQKFDITYKVIDYLKRGNAATPKAKEDKQ